MLLCVAEPTMTAPQSASSVMTSLWWFFWMSMMRTGTPSSSSPLAMAEAMMPVEPHMES